jgi:hypothetical protein
MMQDKPNENHEQAGPQMRAGRWPNYWKKPQNSYNRHSSPQTCIFCGPQQLRELPFLPRNFLHW